MGQSDAQPAPQRENTIIGISLLAMIAVGCSYIFWQWASRSDVIDGVLRCLTFICAMVALHVWGLAAYRWQWQANEHSHPKQPHAVARSSVLRRVAANLHELRAEAALRSVPAQQIIVLFFASCILDGGTAFELCAASAIVYWVSVGINTCTRTNPLTKADAALLTGGFLILLGLVSSSATLVWWLKGKL